LISRFEILSLFFTKSGGAGDSDSRPFESLVSGCVSPVADGAFMKRLEEGFTTKWKTLMNMRTLSVVAIVAAAVSSPVLAQDVDGSAQQRPAHALRHYRGTYNEVQEPGYAVPQIRNGWSTERDFDRSRIGDHDPDLNPAGS
jgi:hypothetical protein